LVQVRDGDWGAYYPGRFELWFVPATGAPEGKLVEDIFKIEGWIRYAPRVSCLCRIGTGKALSGFSRRNNQKEPRNRVHFA
jgi:hypothetical protein